jgi:hypothetical protein
LFGGVVLPDRVATRRVPPFVIRGVPGIDHGVQVLDRVGFGDRDEVVAAKPADVALDPALLVRPGDAGLAVERLDPVVRPECGPAVCLDPLPGEPEDRCDGGLEVVVTDLAGRDPSNMRVSLSTRSALSVSSGRSQRVG